MVLFIVDFRYAVDRSSLKITNEIPANKKPALQGWSSN
jgi:hypothetical protein